MGLVDVLDHHQERFLKAYGRLRGASGDGAVRTRLVGEPVAAPWDPGLATAMARRGIRLEEELTLDVLLTDLAVLRAEQIDGE